MNALKNIPIYLLILGKLDANGMKTTFKILPPKIESDENRIPYFLLLVQIKNGSYYN